MPAASGSGGRGVAVGRGVGVADTVTDADAEMLTLGLADTVALLGLAHPASSSTTSRPPRPTPGRLDPAMHRERSARRLVSRAPGYPVRKISITWPVP